MNQNLRKILYPLIFVLLSSIPHSKWKHHGHIDKQNTTLLNTKSKKPQTFQYKIKQET